MPIGGWWKRAGPAHCTGEARCEKTGSVSQNSPFSFSSTVEWPSRNTLWSAASSNCARVRACTGIGRAGTVGRLVENDAQHDAHGLQQPHLVHFHRIAELAVVALRRHRRLVARQGKTVGGQAGIHDRSSIHNVHYTV